MIVAMARDIRVLVIKLADRLHNMRTVRYVKQSTQERQATESLDIYAPLAHRLGMNTIKWELEDLAFATLHPKVYDEIVRMVADRAPSRDQFLAEVVKQVEGDLKDAKVKATVTGRPKHYYSIYQKMILGGREFTDIYDLVGPAGPGRGGSRLLLRARRAALAVEPRARPVQGLRRDAEVQHVPVAAHDGDRPAGQAGRDPDPHPGHAPPGGVRRRGALEVQGGRPRRRRHRPAGRHGRHVVGAPAARLAAEVEDPGEFLESLRFEINRAEVYVFTPRGDVIALPVGATPVDFAYAVHTEVGHHTIGARVNGRLVPLESTLENSDVVEIFTSKAPNASPSQDWLGFVRSPRARSKIRQWFTKERREEAIERGKEQIAKLMRKEGVPLKRVLSHESLTEAAVHFKLADVSALYAAVGESNLSAQAVVRRVIEIHGGEGGAEEDLSEGVQITGRRVRSKATIGGDAGVIVKGVSDVWVKLAKCCTPVPPDAILGFVTKGGGVSVHRLDCTNAASLKSQPEKLLDVEWAPTAQSTFLVNIQVEALDRNRLLSDITMALSDAHVNILSANLSTTRDRIAKSRFTFEMADAKHLDGVLRSVRSVPGVFDAYRVTQ